MTKRGKLGGVSQDWWAIWPEVLDAELAAYARLGVSPRTVHKGNGILILEADWPVIGRSASMLLRIGYSPLHPFVRPAVAAPKETFERHQSPLSHELCLLTQESGQWDCTQLVADFIQEQLKQLLGALAARKEGRFDEAAKLEEQAADPLMPYFAGACEDDSVILFDGQAMLPTAGHGLMEVVCSGRFSGMNDAAFEGVLRQLKTSSGSVIGKRFGFPTEPKDTQLITGRWVKMTPPATTDAQELLKAAEAELARQAVMQPASVRKVNDAARGSLSITGMVFPEEVKYGPQKNGTGWLFLVERSPLADSMTAGPPRLVRGERAGKEDVFSRLPLAKPLVKKKAVVVGIGAIGSFAGLELARAGVGEVTLIDYDTVQPGNSLRWPLGRSAWGRGKGSGLANFIAENYPWTKANFVPARLGETVTDPAALPHDNVHVLSRMFDLLREANVVVDASASTEVQLAIAHYCRQLGVPYVVGYATYGVAGGLVARFLPGDQGCFVCLHEHWKDGRVPQPPVDDEGVVIPVGCNAPTFTGGGFDLQEVSLEIVRTAVGLLSDGKYEPGAWAVALLTLRNEDGSRTLPRWEGHACPAHSKCCGAGR
ncbi:ThiF family adenylyltransferase [Bradyrhizobium yuanmingense]|uniref:ThiF family adenylyltransferase n=1 Tax=Bradyrhizobium yuanmingense TaxID=108015 RepID=UPI0023B88D41|nr:ThiF family adenylyltransferase [Bradyrhizobium yuanmingense]MDF0582042.1 ThiF family adenylyltransferase [Bradyrhizobium yuanmingense]